MSECGHAEGAPGARWWRCWKARAQKAEADLAAANERGEVVHAELRAATARAEKAEAELEAALVSAGEHEAAEDRLEVALSEARAENTRLREALGKIAGYGKDGICPYGCDTPHIASSALAAREVGRE